MSPDAQFNLIFWSLLIAAVIFTVIFRDGPPWKK